MSNIKFMHILVFVFSFLLVQQSLAQNSEQGTDYPLQLPSSNDFDFILSTEGWTGFDLTSDTKGNRKIYLGINPKRTLSDVFTIATYDHGVFTPKLSLNSDGSAFFDGSVSVNGDIESSNLTITGNSSFGEKISLSSSLTGSGGYTLKIRTIGDDNWGIEHKTTPSDNTLLQGMGFRIKDDGSNGFYIRDITSGSIRMVINNGNVGIGTLTPAYKLDVNGIINATDIKINGNSLLDKMWTPIQGGLSFNGNISVGESISLSSSVTGGEYTLKFKTLGDDNWGIEHKTTPSDNTLLQGMGFRIKDDGSNGFYIRDITSGNIRMVINNGNVGIGTSDPTHKLSVNGHIRAKEITVETGWSDFVFYDDYNLMPLTELEEYINENKHLPEIPTQKEVEENGVHLGEVSSKLLQKIEELTLYVIEQNKRIEKLEEENKELKNNRRK